MNITLNHHQIIELLRMAGSAEDGYSEVEISEGVGHSGEGLYVSLAEYPEEGSVFLDPAPDTSSQAAIQETEAGKLLRLALAPAVIEAAKKLKTESDVQRLMAVEELLEAIEAFEAATSEGTDGS